MKDCSTLPIIAGPNVEPSKIVAQCGKWITLCGKGRHKISYFLGTIQGPVTIWFMRESLEDEIYIHQFDEVIAAAPLKVKSGSFSFDFAPYDLKPGNDEIVLYHEGNTVGSRVHIRLDCIEDPCLPATVVQPGLTETSILCGKYWHQSGYVKKNTIVLGDKPGTVTCQWSVVGTAQVIFYQDKTVLQTITSDREGVFTFEYDPELGEVYAKTQGTGAVDYIFTCPYKDIPVEIPTYEFVCGATTDYTFNAPQLTELKLPVVIGTIDITCTIVATANIVFMQNQVPFYVLSGHDGTVNFSYDYNPDKGKVTIDATGYGQVSLRAKCPYVAPDPIPIDIDAECGLTVETYAGYSNITMDMNGISGDTILDFILTGTTIKIIHGQEEIITDSGSYTMVYDKTVPLIIQARGNDFQMRVSCPIRKPVTGTIDCGVIRSFDSLSNITVRYGSTAGNSTITTSQDVSVYRDNVLMGFGRNVTFFYPGTGVVLVKCDVLDEYLTIDATCPAAKSIACGNTLQNFNAGDIVTVNFATPLIRGHVNVHIEITGNVNAVFRLGNTDVHTSTITETFNQIMNTSAGLKIVTTGSGQFRVYVECAVPIYIVSVVPMTQKVNCAPGETANGIPGGNTFVTASWTITTWSDGNVVTSTKTYDGVCKLPTDAPIQPARWGVAMFANRLFTGGPIASEITSEEAMYGVQANTSPSGRPYTHWANVQDFCDKVMTHTFTPTSIDDSGQFEPTIAVDDFVYLMWDKRAGAETYIVNMGNSFNVTFDGALWRNDLLGNYEGLPGYDANLPIYLTVQYDNGTGLRDWVIVRQETTTLAEVSPRKDKYSVKYLV
jgi:hypothetical protein